jgi:SAM-dependent methyltransferase
MRCRNCEYSNFEDKWPVEVDLGSQPLANLLANSPETARDCTRFPLCAVRCPACSLVQLTESIPDLFTPDYPYRQGQSKTWRRHLEGIVLDCIQRKGHGARTLDVGCNDGTLVAMMQQALMKGYGIDPVPCGERGCYGGLMTRQHVKWAPNYDYVTALNVLAHVPDLDDFLGAIKDCMVPDGILVIEVPNWAQQTWDTIYHEHLSYFTCYTLLDVLNRRGFKATSLESISTHGGSLRAVCGHA